MSAGKFYVTTPIYYVNDQPHIGHAYTTILADVLARYHRLSGAPTFFLTGADEHGQKVARAAERAGMTPQEQADTTVVRFQALWKRLGITNDDFIRTTEPRHTRVVQAILKDLHERDDIYRAEYDGWYCVPCERFYTEKDLVDGKCPEAGCGRPVERITESNYFFRMSKYQGWLVDYIRQHPAFIRPDFRRNETLGFLRKPLNDLCVSRPKKRLSWGIELPFDRDFVTYVWFDALVNYITGVGYGSDDALFRRWWPASCQLIGKDILTTHTVYWPTMLKAVNAPIPETIFAHGWWLVGRDKMSKTEGNVVDPMAFADRYGVDPFRYFLMAEMPLGQDASFTEEAFVRRYNTDLANDLGNMLSRVLKLVHSHAGGCVPAPGAEGAEEAHLREATLQAARAMRTSVEAMELDRGLASLAAALRETNRYFEKRRPWASAKAGDATALGTTLYHALEALRVVGGMLYPVMPEKMAELRAALGLPGQTSDFDDLTRWGVLAAGRRVGEPRSLFPRIEPDSRDPKLATAVKKDAMTPTPQTSPTSPTGPSASTAPTSGAAPVGVTAIAFDEFQKVQLRTAKILEAYKVEGADKLLRIVVEVGEEKRQIVAGIAKHYAPEQIVGKTIVLVYNLAPAKIRSVESNGMLLAATRGEQMRLVTLDGDLPSGAMVK
ncbi:MAG: methionine--tRNA ligase [Verrucomicrobiota bacterium]|nr:methionine--tRNA ligase [Verrucomicrobiota bacterium]